MEFYTNLIEQLPAKYQKLATVMYIEHKATYEEVSQVIVISERTFYRRKKELGTLATKIWQEKQNSTCSPRKNIQSL